VLKEDLLQKARDIFVNTGVQVTSVCCPYVGAALELLTCLPNSILMNGFRVFHNYLHNIML